MVKGRNNSEPSISDGLWAKKSLVTDILGVFSLILCSKVAEFLHVTQHYLFVHFSDASHLLTSTDKSSISAIILLLYGCSLLISENSFKFTNFSLNSQS